MGYRLEILRIHHALRRRLAYTVVWRGRRIAVAITPETVSVRLVAGTLPVTIHGRSVTLTRRMVSLPLRPAKQ